MLNFVSKRLQRAAAAMLCLMALQIGLGALNGARAAQPVAGAFAISR
jgi:hypothetical protein